MNVMTGVLISIVTILVLVVVGVLIYVKHGGE